MICMESTRSPGIVSSLQCDFLDSGGNILVQPSRAIREYGRLRRPERFFAGFAHVAFPAEMPHAQNLQKRCGQRLCLCLYERIASTVLDTLGSRSAGLDR